MTMYNYDKSPVSVGTLTTEIQAESGITTPFVSMTYREPDDLGITFSGSLSAGEQTLLATIVSGHLGQFPVEPANLPSGDYEAGRFIVTDGTGRTRWVDGFESTVSGVDPEEDHDIGTKRYIDLAVAGSEITYLGFSHSLTWNGPIDIIGWHRAVDSSVALSSGSPITISKSCFNARVIVDVSDIVGSSFTITVSGISLDDNTGDMTTEDYENLNITSSGTYMTSKKWLNAPQLLIVESGKSCTLDIYGTTYYTHSGRDFAVRAIRFEFEPDSPNWDITLEILHIHCTGELHYTENVTYDNLDAIPRADVSEKGMFKKINYYHTISGSLHEGLIIRADQTGIRHFYVGVEINDVS